MSALAAVRFPTHLPGIGIHLPAVLSPLTVVDGSPAWAWTGSVPKLGIPTFTDPVTPRIESDWGVDHVVITVPDLHAGVDALVAVGVDLRRTGTTARGQTAAFLLAGPLIEMIEVPGRPAALAGLALETRWALEDVATRWRAAGLDPGAPHDAVQPGRRIVSVGRVAVMTPRSPTDE